MNSTEVNIEEPRLFGEWMESKMKFEQVYYTQMIALKCDVCTNNIYKWRKSDKRIRKPFRIIINEVAKEEVFPID